MSAMIVILAKNITNKQKNKWQMLTSKSFEMVQIYMLRDHGKIAID